MSSIDNQNKSKNPQKEMKQKEKTIKEWLNTLDEPYKSKALRQTNKDILELQCNSITNALLKMFEWESSKEGDLFWDNLYVTLENQ